VSGGKVLQPARIFLAVTLIASGTFVRAVSQTASQEKREPSERRMELPKSARDTNRVVARSEMPKIDLPNYVITGNAVIDLPRLEKLSAAEDSEMVSLASILNPAQTRSRITAQTGLQEKETIVGGENGSYYGRGFASLGTFFSPQAGLSYGRTVGDYRYSFDGRYYGTKGFAPYTNRSGGSLNLGGSTTFTTYNPYFDQSELHAYLAYKTDTYLWYGTLWPAVSRNRADVTVSADLANWNRSPIPYSGELSYGNFTVIDSSSTVSENRLRLAGQTRVVVSGIPFTTGVHVRFSSIADKNASSGLLFLDATIGSQRYAWDRVSLEGALHGYLANGMAGQHLLRLYPHIDVAYRINDQHTMRASFTPTIQPASLSSQIFDNRYLAGQSTIKHTDDQLDGSLALESEWSTVTSTTLRAQLQTFGDFPLYADSLSRGVWTLAYGGRTTIASLSGEVFAKLPANDYFAAEFKVSSSHNSLTGSAVPYLPVFEIGCDYKRQFTASLEGEGTLTLIHQRKDNVVRVNTLPSILLVSIRGEYRLLDQAKVFLDVQNLLNEQYEYWRGYQEYPFVVSVGIIIRW
jgi:hypothetical protein